MADYSKMKVVELKAELKRLGLPQNGLKAELVSRLEEAAASETPAEPAETADISETHPSEDVEPVNETSEMVEAASPTQENPAESVVAPAQAGSADDTPAQVTSTATVSEEPSLPATEVVQDVHKRKRRSITPPPSEDAARKRLRPDDSDLNHDASLNPASSSDKTSKLENEAADHTSMLDADADADISAEKADVSMDKAPEPTKESISRNIDSTNEVDEIGDTHAANNGGATTTVDSLEDPEDGVMVDDEATRTGALDQDQEKRSPSPERDIEPSMHPATCALYIKNFMRPLRPQAVQDHLLELATPANTPLDPSIIVNFYLDNIRTHAFAVFTSISAASRVRTALHKRIWPDETNRKSLWIDFIPPEYFEDWISTEQQARDKGNMPRYEVIYERDSDDSMTVRLEETDANQPTRRVPVSPVAHPDRRPSIPTGPSRPSGIENAPTGPRNPYAHNGPPVMYADRQDRLDSGFIKTRSTPQILYRPVASEVTNRRLDCLAQAKDPHYDEESGKDYHRYYFEREDVLVNRGPEIFLGIRPPHREKERRELARTGGGDVRDRSFRDRRGAFGPPGGGGGGRRRRNRAPRHGVPRGGDRFRPGSNYDDRSAPDERHMPRRDGYGGSNRRKDGYRH
ncbi:hypothetical protein F5B22DRAFT_252582 [Xylaria bambusicola]|uniref:uncharacterized protein n=1 Tax=Xylaria bambusicola TaxID=326684 RepID=UPI0020072DFB|nr:uncharacterized protein F5B22DRAFT_252582 [Xylaria bambusicola]KAI0525768.1 hypothetical protein F5B22DRAFT_252582 [Xylaria bambusicola]